MASFPELYLTWKDKEYACSLTIGVIRKMEREGSLLEIIENLSGYPPKISVISWVIFCFLDSAGAEVTEDDIWEVIRSGELPSDYVASIRDFMLVEAFGTGPEKKSKKPQADTEDGES